MATGVKEGGNEKGEDRTSREKEWSKVGKRGVKSELWEGWTYIADPKQENGV